MKNLFVPYPIASALKDKGFDEPCLGGYLLNGEFAEPDNELNCFRNRNRSGGEISAPLYQQVVDWLRDEHGMRIKIEPTIKDGLDLFLYHNVGWHWQGTYRDDYEALDAAINHALTLIP